MVTKTIKSRSVISVGCLAGDMADEMVMEIFDTLEMMDNVTYKNYPDQQEDSITGQKLKGTASEYEISARVEPQYLEDNLVLIGTLQDGDAIIYLPARIRYDRNHDPIAGIGDIRPKKYDEIVCQGITYRIVELTFQEFGEKEIYVECLCNRVE